MKYISLSISVVALIISLIALYKPQNKVSENTGNQIESLEKQQSSDFINAISWEIPDTLFFAGERVPMEREYIREMFDRELHINTYWHNNTIFLLKRANRWLPQMKEILDREGIPNDFLYLAVIESGLVNAISPSGAVGFWQFMEGTAGDFGLEISEDVDERYHPVKSTEAAARYLKKAYGLFKNWTNVAAAYNRGMNGMDRALENQQVESYYDALLNSETSRYLFRILAIKTIFENPRKYGFDIKEAHLYKPEKVKYVEVEENIEDLTVWAKAQGINLLLLKRHNPWLRSNQLKSAKGEKKYQIALPD